jgi:hypothetical protein
MSIHKRRHTAHTLISLLFSSLSTCAKLLVEQILDSASVLLQEPNNDGPKKGAAGCGLRIQGQGSLEQDSDETLNDLEV